MSKFGIYKWEDGRLLLEYQEGAEHARIMFPPSALADLASAAQAALAKQNSGVKAETKCEPHPLETTWREEGKKIGQEVMRECKKKRSS